MPLPAAFAGPRFPLPSGRPGRKKTGGPLPVPPLKNPVLLPALGPQLQLLRRDGIARLRVGEGGPLLRQGASCLNFSGPSPWAAGVGRLRKRKRAGGKAVNSEYAGTDAFIAYCRSCRLVFQLLSRHRHHRPPVGGHRGVLLVLSAARSSPRRPFCPLASLTCLLRRGTRKGSWAPYLFFNL